MRKSGQRFFTLRPSRLLVLLIILLCLSSLAMLWLLPLPTTALLFMTMLLPGWCGHKLWRDAALRLPQSVEAFRLEEKDAAVLMLRNGKKLQCRVCPDSLVTPGLVILNVALGERRTVRSLMILPDAMGRADFRRLRVLLRWGETPDQTPL